MNDEQKPQAADHGNTVVVFNLSEERREAKKKAARERRSFLRDRQSDRLAEKKIAR